MDEVKILGINVGECTERGIYEDENISFYNFVSNGILEKILLDFPKNFPACNTLFFDFWNGELTLKWLDNNSWDSYYRKNISLENFKHG